MLEGGREREWCPELVREVAQDEGGRQCPVWLASHWDGKGNNRPFWHCRVIGFFPTQIQGERIESRSVRGDMVRII